MRGRGICVVGPVRADRHAIEETRISAMPATSLLVCVGNMAGAMTRNDRESVCVCVCCVYHKIECENIKDGRLSVRQS